MVSHRIMSTPSTLETARSWQKKRDASASEVKLSSGVYSDISASDIESTPEEDGPDLRMGSQDLLSQRQLSILAFC